MSTTIQISDNTIDVLKRIRQQLNASSYDEAIQQILRDARRQKSMYGYLGKTVSKKELLRDLRDERDRH
ncbi:MAG: hypothetical protein AABX47_09010 [Nanoarchaeota archaeon]